MFNVSEKKLHVFKISQFKHQSTLSKTMLHYKSTTFVTYSLAKSFSEPINYKKESKWWSSTYIQWCLYKC